jgi:hypothetical protein
MISFRLATVLWLGGCSASGLVQNDVRPSSGSGGGTAGQEGGGAAGFGTGTGGPGGTAAEGGSVGSSGAANAADSAAARDTGVTGSDGGLAPDFWDNSDIPAARNALMFKFLNRTNGRYTDSEIFWSFQNQVHSIAEMPLFDMPANSAGRMYFYLGAPNSRYFDFIEFTIGPTVFNGNTTRVDAFGIKIAMRLHCADGYDVAVGEDYETFVEDRTVTFQKFLDAVPAEFAACATEQMPFRIIEPGAAGFNQGGPQQHYYDTFVDALWAANALTIPKPGPNGSGLGAFPDISAAIYRHVGDAPGSFTPEGRLANRALWADASTFYLTAPADFYAKFWHAHSLGHKTYAFPYDDVGSYSSYISHQNPQYLLIAIGW